MPGARRCGDAGARKADMAISTGPVRRAAPRFEDLRVPTPIPARKKRAEIADRAPDVDKQLSDAAKEGPDFAGHFFISE